jgi:hypothetical protein
MGGSPLSSLHSQQVVSTALSFLRLAMWATGESKRKAAAAAHPQRPATFALMYRPADLVLWVSHGPCVGSGLSPEPWALAAAGFDVTAVDLSPLALHLVQGAQPQPDDLSRLIAGREFKPGGRTTLSLATYETARSVPVRLMSMSLSSGGCCSCFRKNNWRWRQRPSFSDRLRAASASVIVTTDGGDPAEPATAARDWFRRQRWPALIGQTLVVDRVAWLYTSTG